MNAEPIPFTPVVSSYFPVLIFGFQAAVLFVLAFIFVSILLFRDRNVMSRRTGGAITLTIASIILLSGLWCYTLSPTRVRYDHETIVRGETPMIGALQTQTYYIELNVGERLTGDINCEEAVFILQIYSPEGALVRSVPNVTTSGLTVEALKSGSYKVEVENPNPESIKPFIYIGKEVEGSYRPLVPAGQWLSLISIPVFALGIWAYLENKLHFKLAPRE